MAVVSHEWPGINPLTVYDLPVYWWAYYVRAADRILTERRKAVAERG